MIIKKKTWTEAFEKILSGEKTFDARLANFDCKPGDILVLEEWDPKTKKYTGRKITKQISYVGKFSLDSFGQRELVEKNGFYIFGLK